MADIGKQRILRFLGHIVRRNGAWLEKRIFQGKVEGKRGRGRTAMKWIDQWKTFTGMSLEEAMRKARNREEWKNTVKTI